jgi:hypothetical protein
MQDKLHCATRRQRQMSFIHVMKNKSYTLLTYRPAGSPPGPPVAVPRPVSNRQPPGVPAGPARPAGRPAADMMAAAQQHKQQRRRSAVLYTRRSSRKPPNMRSGPASSAQRRVRPATAPSRRYLPAMSTWLPEQLVAEIAADAKDTAHGLRASDPGAGRERHPASRRVHAANALSLVGDADLFRNLTPARQQRHRQELLLAVESGAAADVRYLWTSAWLLPAQLCARATLMSCSGRR